MRIKSTNNISALISTNQKKENGKEITSKEKMSKAEEEKETEKKINAENFNINNDIINDKFEKFINKGEKHKENDDKDMINVNDEKNKWNF